jgi:NAD(P)-dependent dehydrogenase (short-subunit alcohol dehydrogenase family)
MLIQRLIALIGVSLSAKKTIELKTHGGIILTSSAGGLRSRPRMAPYTMSKYAVRGLTVTAGQELAEYGIRVNAACPG